MSKAGTKILPLNGGEQGSENPFFYAAKGVRWSNERKLEPARVPFVAEERAARAISLPPVLAHVYS